MVVRVGNQGSGSRGGLLLGPQCTRSEARGSGTPTADALLPGSLARWSGLSAVTQAGLNAMYPGEEPVGSQGAVLVTGLRSSLGRRHGPSTPDGFLHAGALATGSGKPGRAVQLALVSVLLPDVVFAGRSILQTQLGPGPEQLGSSSECLDAPFLPTLRLPACAVPQLPAQGSGGAHSVSPQP